VSTVEIHEHRAGSVLVVSLCGDLDSGTAPAVHERLRALLPADGRVLVDLSGVPYMSSAGLRTMLLLHRQARATRTAVALAGLSPDLRGMMEATGFLGYFTVDDTVAAGVRGLEAARPGEAAS
jgi:anti-sigma B factor antagonist